MVRCHELEIGRSEVEDFLDAGVSPISAYETDCGY